MKYIYGPVKSRRLGNSLGITTVPYKVCSFDCVYCQLKKTTEKTNKRKMYGNEKDILKEIRVFFQQKPKNEIIDYITFSGSGEPTLNKSLGRIIKGIKSITDTPVALITNSSTIFYPALRREIMNVDLVVPSLDAVTQDIFEKLDNPAQGISVKNIIKGLIDFRCSFKGSIWLEIMLVNGINDSIEYLNKIKETASLIKPDKIHINCPVRPPSMRWVKCPSPQTLKKAKEIFGEICEVV